MLRRSVVFLFGFIKFDINDPEAIFASTFSTNYIQFFQMTNNLIQRGLT